MSSDSDAELHEAEKELTPLEKEFIKIKA
jgi:hypothetical protein